MYLLIYLCFRVLRVRPIRGVRSEKEWESACPDVKDHSVKCSVRMDLKPTLKAVEFVSAMTHVRYGIA